MRWKIQNQIYKFYLKLSFSADNIRVGQMSACITKSSGYNGPVQMSEVAVIETDWKLSDSNNGYLKTENGPEDTLLGGPPVATVVQVSGSGARTMVLPGRTKPIREKCLVISVCSLAILCCIFLLLLISGKEMECTSGGEYFFLLTL